MVAARADESHVALVLLCRHTRMAVDFAPRWFHPKVIHGPFLEIILTGAVCGKHKFAAPEWENPDSCFPLRYAPKFVEMEKHGRDSFCSQRVHKLKHLLV